MPGGLLLLPGGLPPVPGGPPSLPGGVPPVLGGSVPPSGEDAGAGCRPRAQPCPIAWPSGPTTVTHHRVAGCSPAARIRSRVTSASTGPNAATSPGVPESPRITARGTVTLIRAARLPGGPPAAQPGTPGPSAAAGDIPQAGGSPAGGPPAGGLPAAGRPLADCPPGGRPPGGRPLGDCPLGDCLLGGRLLGDCPLEGRLPVGRLLGIHPGALLAGARRWAAAACCRGRAGSRGRRGRAAHPACR